MYCLFTNDVETTSIWHNSLRNEMGWKVYNEGMPMLLDLYKRYEIKTTFFFTGYIAKLCPEIVKMVVPYGHEVASHGMSHEKCNGFDVLPLKKQISHLIKSKKILEDLSGHEVVSFRAPALRVSNNTVYALEESGYKFDSSIASQRFDMLLSIGAIKKLNWLTAPRLPYRASKNNLFRKGKSDIIEIPLSATLIPYVGTTMRTLPKITGIQRKLLALEAKKTGKPIVFDIHPNEFIDESGEESLRIKRVENMFISFFQDTIRSKLKINNLGIKGYNLYKNQVEYFIKKNFKFCSVKDFASKLDL